MEAAKRSGMTTGVVATSSVTDATPASFATHAPLRAYQKSIALQYAVNKTADLILGGGRAYFDSLDLPAAMAAGAFGGRAYEYVNSSAALSTVRKLPVIGLFAEGNIPWELDRDSTTTPGLVQMADAALRLLHGAAGGFFVMIEGSKIDKAAHRNDAAAYLKEILTFDETIGLVLDFARADGETLVVITADHETGGLSLGRSVSTTANDSEAALHTRSLLAEANGESAAEYAYYVDVLANVTMSAEGMAVAALEAARPAAHVTKGNFTAELKSSPALQRALLDARVATVTTHAFSPLLPQELALLQEAVDLFPRLGPYGIVRAIASVVSARAWIGWSSWGHSGTDVMIYATGPGEDRFAGNMENAEIGRRVARLMGWDLDEVTAALGTPVFATNDSLLEHMATEPYAAWM